MTMVENEWPAALDVEADELDDQADAAEDHAAVILAEVGSWQYETDVDGIPVVAPDPVTRPAAGRAERLAIGAAADLLKTAASLRRTATSKRDLAGRLGGVTTPPAPGIVTIASTAATTSVTFTWTYGTGGSVTGQTFTERTPGTTHNVADDTGALRTATVTGLAPNTPYTWLFNASGPGGDRPVTIAARTLPQTTAGAALSFPGASTTAVGDNVALLTVAKPGGAVAGETLLFVYSRDEGIIQPNTIGPTSAMTEITTAQVGTVNGAHLVRVYLLPLTAANIGTVSFDFRSDPVSSSTVVSCRRIAGAPVVVASAAVTANAGTDTTIDTPSLSGVVDGVWVGVGTYAPSPLPTAGRTSTVAGATETVDAGTVSGYHNQTVAMLATTSTAAVAKTFTVSGAVTWTNTVAVVLAPAGGNPAITGFTPTQTNTSTTFTRITGPVAGNFDTVGADTIGDGLGPQTLTGAGSATYTVDIARQTAATTVWIDFTPVLGDQTTAATRFGPYTIPAATGTVLAAQSAQTGPAHLNSDRTGTGGWTTDPVTGVPLLENKNITGVSWNIGGAASVIEQFDGIRPISSAALINNVTANGGTDGAQTYFGVSANITDLWCLNWGGGIYYPGNPNPLNGHGFYGIRRGRAKRVTIQAPIAGVAAGSYAWHMRSGSDEFDCEYETVVEQSNQNSMIGGAPIRHLLIAGGEKLGGGEFILGGLAGGVHYECEVRDYAWNRLRLMGDWQVRLAFVNCTARTLDDRSSGQKTGVRAVGGLVVTG